MQWLASELPCKESCETSATCILLLLRRNMQWLGVINAMVGVRTAMQGVVRDKRNMHPALVASLSHVSSSSLLLFSNYVIA